MVRCGSSRSRRSPSVQSLDADHDNDTSTPERVVEQRAVVGDGPTPVTNATFSYSGVFDSTTKTWSGSTIVKDAFRNPTTYQYTQNLITSELDPETPAETREW